VIKISGFNDVKNSEYETIKNMHEANIQHVNVVSIYGMILIDNGNKVTMKIDEKYKSVLKGENIVKYGNTIDKGEYQNYYIYLLEKGIANYNIENPELFYNNVTEGYAHLAKNGFIHLDLHERNVISKNDKNNKVEKYMIIDFDQMWNYSKIVKMIEDILATGDDDVKEKIIVDVYDSMEVFCDSCNIQVNALKLWSNIFQPYVLYHVEKQTMLNLLKFLLNLYIVEYFIIGWSYFVSNYLDKTRKEYDNVKDEEKIGYDINDETIFSDYMNDITSKLCGYIKETTYDKTRKIYVHKKYEDIMTNLEEQLESIMTHSTYKKIMEGKKKNLKFNDEYKKDLEIFCNLVLSLKSCN